MKIPTLKGEEVSVKLLGVPKITENDNPKANIKGAYKLFPHLPAGVLERPAEEVGMLLGQDQAGLLPTGGTGRDKVGNLRVLQLDLGQGYVLGGHHPDLAVPGVSFSSLANGLRKSSVSRQQPKLVNHIERCSVPYLDPEDISITPARRCNRCRNCQQCTLEVQEMSRKEQDELALIRSSIKVEEGRLVAQYPVTGHLGKLKDNEWQARKMAEQLERRLVKGGGLEAYNKEFRIMEEFPAIREVSREELETRKAEGKPINFISHHDVNRPDKATTKKRLVSNSSLPNCGRGPSVNELWPKGPNLLKPAYQIFIRFRTYEVALQFDLTKAYWTIKTTEEETFLRLLLWRYGKAQEDWRVFGYIRVAFGDRPAMAILEVGKDMAAELGKSIDPQAASIISEDSYCDDGLGGGSEEDVTRMMGECTVKEDGTLSFSGTLSSVLATVGFKPKMIIKSGENHPAALEKSGGSVLGHAWDPSSDKFCFTAQVNISKKKKDGHRSEPDLTPETLHLLKTYIPSKISVLSIVNSLYDPTGILLAYFMKYRLFMREVSVLQQAWDAPLPEVLAIRWRELLEELVRFQPVFIPRCVRPSNAQEPPELICFWDGSQVAYAATVYLRYLVREERPGLWASGLGTKEEWRCRLLASKGKLAPLAGITPPRSEMNGFVIAHRLTHTILAALKDKPSRVSFLGDSECTISAAECNSASLKPYMANRVSEVDDLRATWQLQYPGMKLDQTYHIAGELNISADMATRGFVKAEEMEVEGPWQSGPAFLAEERRCWPASREFLQTSSEEQRIPEEECRGSFFGLLNSLQQGLEEGRESGKAGAILETLKGVLNYSDSLQKCRGIMARVLRASRRSSAADRILTKEEQQTVMAAPLSCQDYDSADRIILLLSQTDIREVLEGRTRLRKKPGSCDFSSMQPFKEEGIWYTRGRLGQALKRILGPDKLPILSSSSRLAFLQMEEAHCQNHMAGGDTLFRSRCLSWIVRGRTLADRLARNCLTCIFKRKKLMGQQMGDLPEERTLVPGKPWTATSLDLLGSYEVRAMNNSRSRKKCYPVVCCCMSTGGLHIELASDYGADAFLLAYGAFLDIRGRPSMVYTDQGSQLAKASEYLVEEDPLGWDWSKVREVEARSKTSWRFCPPGAQYRNGLAEARVKALKHTLDLLMPKGASSLNFNEFRCLLTKCSNIINDRPLGIRHLRRGVEGELIPVTPNTLLLGRNSRGA